MRLLFGALIVLLPFSARSADGNTGAIPLNEFRHVGGTLVCFSDHETSMGYLPCLHIGGLEIGMAKEKAEIQIINIGGKLVSRILKTADVESRIYRLKNSKKNKNPLTLTITYLKGFAEKMQLTGEESDVPLEFSSIRLGDDVMRVISLIGPPLSSEPISKSQATIWNYNPFPIIIEFEKGKVHSISIERDAHDSFN